MSQIVRQSELFSAEDWKVIYRAFTDVNFNAYDYDTIRQSMIEYVRFNYPEDFNDWIESSEFVALIDLLAYLGQSLAFRMDLNTRENFIDTAERKSSILRMARLLSYVPNRNIAARGVLKVVGVSTTENVSDSFNQNLQNRTIVWNDANNPDWYEQWITVFNAAFLRTNPFGKPVKSGTVDSIPTQLYEIDTNPTGSGQYAFSSTVAGNRYSFEVVNPDFETGATFTERTPDPLYNMHMIYQSDGNGNDSENTGFFAYFKQGSTQFQDFQLSSAIENRVLDVNTDNINQNDVWVQTVTENGLISREWTKVPALAGNNVIFNSLNNDLNDIYSIVTRDRDQVSLRFGDGVFGTVPTGLLRVYYRTSANASYTIKPSDMRGVTISVPYFATNGDRETLTITMDLQSSVSNSSPSETLEQIRSRAPQVYYTQNRMVNGEDYNVYPLRDSSILKLKSINRTYSGHSRYIDLNDPTSTSQSVKIPSDDGALYKENVFYTDESSLQDNLTSVELMSNLILPRLQDGELIQFYYANYPKQAASGIFWQQATTLQFASTGNFVDASNLEIAVGDTTPPVAAKDYILPGALLKFAEAGWVMVQSVTDNGIGQFDSGRGKITLSEEVSSGDEVISILPVYRNTLSSTERALVLAEIDDQNSFGLRFDQQTQEWKLITAPNLSAETDEFSFANAGDTSLANLDSSWLVRMDFEEDGWKLTSRGLRYTFESKKDVRFYVNQFYNVQGLITGRSSDDFIKIPSTQSSPNNPAQGIGEDITFAITDVELESDGYQIPERVRVGFSDLDQDGVPDNPEIFDILVGTDSYIFHKKQTDVYGYEYWSLDYNVVIVSFDTVEGFADVTTTTTVYNEDDDEYLIWQGGDKTDRNNYVVAEGEWRRFEGRWQLNFVWNHFADKDRRIDPAIGNIIDMFVLTSGYDSEMRNWVADPTSNVEPLPPTSADLKIAYSSLETNKMSSDEMIWRPVKYKVLFGNKAPEELRAVFKVVKVAGSDRSDSEIRARVLAAINEYFDLTLWDFGDTFFASELIAYIHQRLATVIGGVELVPVSQNSNFGELQQVRSESNELFLSAAQVTDIEIVNSFNKATLRISS